ncbi:MAG: helical backbone metal receptor [Desulfurococcales archaeon]|nr:helical backbone metal receptor [Desulfurococcales archaeon]
MGKPSAMTLTALVIVLVIIAAEFAVLDNRLNSLQALIEGQNNKLGSINKTLSQQQQQIQEQGKAISNIGSKVSQQNSEMRGINQTILGVKQSVDTNIKLLQERLNNTEREIAGIKQQVETLSAAVNKITGYPRTVVDFAGQTVIIPAQPERIISLAPSITEIIFALGQQDKLVGVDEYSNYPPQLSGLEKSGKIQIVGGFSNPNYEKIVSLKPDVVFTVQGVQLQIAHRLRNLGLKVVVLGTKDMNDIVSSVILIGKVLGVDDTSLKLAEGVTGDIENLATISNSFNTTPTVGIIVWNNPLFVVGQQSFITSLIELAGGENAFYNYTQAYPMISPEDLLNANPDIIIFTEGSGVSNYTNALAWLKSIPGGTSLKAVQAGKIYVLHGTYSDMLVRPGIRSPTAGILLLAIIHLETGSNIPHDVSPSTWNLTDYASHLESTYNVTFPLFLS